LFDFLRQKKLGIPETSLTATSQHRVTYQKSETITKLRFTNLSPNGKRVCICVYEGIVHLD